MLAYDTTIDKIEAAKQKFIAYFKIQSFLEMISKKLDLIAVPFYVGATKINENCSQLYFSKVGSETIYWCAAEEFKYEYSKTGAKMVSCNECPFCKLK